MQRFTLRVWRLNAELTQKQVAAKLNRSNKTIGSWEKGLSFPEPKDIDALCELYGITYDQIIFLDNSSLKADFKGETLVQAEPAYIEA